jgi:hypothetical protein
MVFDGSAAGESESALADMLAAMLVVLRCMVATVILRKLLPEMLSALQLAVLVLAAALESRALALQHHLIILDQPKRWLTTLNIVKESKLSD